MREDPQQSALEKLFIDIAGDDMEVDWMELKRILDHSMRDGELNILLVIILSSTLLINH